MHGDSTPRPRRMVLAWACVSLGVGLRIVLWLTGLHAATRHRETPEWTAVDGWAEASVHDPVREWLGGVPIFDTPFTSRVGSAECLALVDLGVSPYAGSVCRDPPLLIALHSGLRHAPGLRGLLWIALDCLSGALLAGIAVAGRRRRAAREQRRLAVLSADQQHSVRAAPVMGVGTLADGGLSAAAFWLLNPVAIVCCGAGSTTTLHAVLALAALHGLARGRILPAAVVATCAGYLDVYYGLLLVPIVLSRGVPDATAIAVCGTAVATLAAVSYELDGSWQWLDVVHGAALRVDDFTPNTGLCWYLLTIMFPHFRLYFLSLIHVNTVVATSLLSIRLRDDPVFLGTVLLGVAAVLKTYPATPDFVLVLSLLAARPELRAFLSFTHLAGGALVALAILAPVFWHTWMHDAGGNANFFYALTLAYSITQCVVLNDHLRAHLTLEHLLRHGAPTAKLKLV
eukprot:m.159380 g.159380  ORF g.159380 m.159380 type:complete len:457 (+) comp23738_c0_seq1:93-1463(+)